MGSAAAALDVLVVDDAKFGRLLLQKALPKDRQIAVRTANNGREALKEVMRKRPDIVFLDLTMPVMNGFEVLKRLRRQRIDVPVIVASADIQSGAVARVHAMGACRMICKPVTAGDVRQALDEFCRTDR